MIQRLAMRVREARTALGLPRRALSELSGVSPRYLAQLEAGEGNISVLLLHRVAVALKVSVEDLLSERVPLDGDVARVAQLFCSAPASLQGRVRALLAPQNQPSQRAQRICLLGMRGAGKSTLGKLAAERLKVPFVTLDDETAAQAGMQISEIKALYGADGYQAFEMQALERVIERHDRMILEVEGGIVSQDTTYDQVLERFHTIWVRTSPEEHIARVRAAGDPRPIDDNPMAIDQLRTYLTTRTPLYERALKQLNTSEKPVTTSVIEMLSIFADNQFLYGIGQE